MEHGPPDGPTEQNKEVWVFYVSLLVKLTLLAYIQNIVPGGTIVLLTSSPHFIVHREGNSYPRREARLTDGPPEGYAQRNVGKLAGMFPL